MYIPNLIMIAARIQGCFVVILDDGQSVVYHNYQEIPDELKGYEVSQIKAVDGIVHLSLHRNAIEVPQDYAFECGV